MNSVTQNSNKQNADRSFNNLLPQKTLIGFIIAVFAVLLTSLLSYRSLENNMNSAERLSNTQNVIEHLEKLISTIKDAETGQRGFLLTGVEQYTAPYTNARAEFSTEFKTLKNLKADNPQQLQQLDIIEKLISIKMAELAETIELRRAGQIEKALAIVRTDRGKDLMDRIRSAVDTMQNKEKAIFVERREETAEVAKISLIFTFASSAVLLFLILSAAVIASRDYRYRERERWIKAGQMLLGNRLQGDQPLSKLGDNILEFLAGYINVQVGAVYISRTHDQLLRFASYAIAPDEKNNALQRGDGLVGQAAKENRLLHIREVPANYLNVSSSVGRTAPLELMVIPASVDGIVYGVIELGFFHSVHEAENELLSLLSESIGIAIRSSKDRTRLEELLEETQRQTEELQTQQEELRVSNEELEEQSHILKESQAQLENQQTELEQSNSHLEEQTQILETQKDELSKIQTALIEKAADLQRANQYKSEFLANMSHELRTPLNSTLILSKLLSENKQGNLTDDQIKFASTIFSAGNDLLTLINDILDLSKIEAGKIEINPEITDINRLLNDVISTISPLAHQKQLQLKSTVELGAIKHIETDSLRVNQILKNLLSNAIKFTSKGDVFLRTYLTQDGRIAFEVKDTGIGISVEQQKIIFDAFRQADGSTHRKYGGTGLGLSISRDLARLLGGDIFVESVEGKGSTFTLILPLVYQHKGEKHSIDRAPVLLKTMPLQSQSKEVIKLQVVPQVDDDREHINPDARLILIIEDDASFASIMRDLARERDFQCVVASTAEDGLIAAINYHPHAILLDINLPDYSGLGVLDQLKRNSKTRHIPVHIISVADYSHEALERGAIGYALKPIKREELVETFNRLESKFSQNIKRVLVIEDDERQRESIRQLLGSDGVEIIASASAHAALEKLRTMAFDCVVMDLNLPDLSGYELLEKMAEHDEIAFPPVIVYTGRSLTRDEEQKLRRFSKSIIVKDARSPERLLDEVTLFLHQVESKLPPESQRMLKVARDRESTFEGKRILVVEDDVRNIFALSSVLEPKGAKVEIARTGKEALVMLEKHTNQKDSIDIVLMDIMMPEMDGITAMKEIRKRQEWKKLPIIALTAKAMKDDQEKCFAAGANDYIAKPLDVEKLLSLLRVWLPR